MRPGQNQNFQVVFRNSGADALISKSESKNERYLFEVKHAKVAFIFLRLLVPGKGGFTDMRPEEAPLVSVR